MKFHSYRALVVLLGALTYVFGYLQPPTEIVPEIVFGRVSFYQFVVSETNSNETANQRRDLRVQLFLIQFRLTEFDEKFCDHSVVGKPDVEGNIVWWIEHKF